MAVGDTMDGGGLLLGPERPVISLVIPAYNEERYLPRTLESVDVARECWRRDSSLLEVIVADNVSMDRTATIARARGCRVVTIEERRIAAVRNGGAAIAAGEILCFVDADSVIHPETFNEIEDALATGRVVAGATGVRMERWSLGIAVTYAVLMPMVWLSRMDTGVVFCAREDFEAVGGYDERRFFGEDVQLLWDLRRIGCQRKQRLARLRSVKALASTRKFDTHGEWHYFTGLFLLLPKLLWSPHATTDYANKFWYGEQRTPKS
ncbi:MAG: glycosyltransferase [Acidobacteria bacterium]|jgi:glycosyltransferase involved in cell wall biosynthesis|nr:glycosyltransferase [Acidobacteriota bacterium]